MNAAKPFAVLAGVLLLIPVVAVVVVVGVIDQIVGTAISSCEGLTAPTPDPPAVVARWGLWRRRMGRRGMRRTAAGSPRPAST